MERELFRRVYQFVHRLGRQRRSPRMVHPDWKIVMVYMWSVLHDRPTCWACCARHWPQEARAEGGLPSASTMSRRLRRADIAAFITEVEMKLRRALTSDASLMFIDAKPLPVGPCTKDPQAKAGYAGAGLGKGYKLHALCDSQRIPHAWCVRPMNENEAVVAPELIDQLPIVGAGVLTGDNAYDTNHLYEVAAARGWQLYAPRKRSQGLGHRHHSRWRVIAQLHHSEQWRAELRKARLQIERFFAHLTGGSLGLDPLPSWVRGLRRVRQWVQAKIIVYLARRRLLQAQSIS